ncbi:MAG: hypothetical protein ABR551_09940 [Gemmatimonadales bacterium]
MKRIGGVLAVAALAAAPLVAQQPAAQQPAAPTPLAVGREAPAFSLMGGTREGVTGPVWLEDFQDKTLVISFFYRARSRG